MSNSKSGLPYDELGFLIGLKQTGRDLAKIDKNVEAIAGILLKLQKDFEGKLSDSQQQFKPKLSALEQALIDAQIKPVDIADIIKEQANPMIQSTVILDRVAKSLEDLIEDVAANKNAPKSKTTQVHQKAIEIDSPESVIREPGTDESKKQNTQGPKEVTPRPRDSKGRFIGDGSIENENKSKLGKVIQSIGTAFKDVMPNTPQGVDPTVDAINEVATVLSPVKRAAGFMLRPLTGWMKSRKRNEPLPKEQSDHNRKQIKLLQRLVDNLQSKGGLLGSIGKLLGAGGGVLGSLFGGILKNGGKLLKFGKGLPVIGALLTAMSFSNWGNKSTKEKGGAVGSTAGGLIGGAIGSIFGPIGTVAGAGLGAIIGEKIGGAAAPYIKQWTDSLIAADIPSMVSKLISSALSLTPGGIVKSLADWGKEKWNSTFNGQPNPSYLMRRQYGGKGVNNGEPAPFGAVAKQTYAIGKYAPLLDEIARGESKHGGAFGTFGYDTVYSGAKIKPPKPISQMTIGEVKAYQKQLLNSGSNSSPVGRYQFIKNGDAFAKQVAKAGLKDTDIFNAENQDRLAIHYAGGEKQVDKWIKNRDFTSLTNKTAEQWAGLKNSRGVGNYDNDGLNKARAGGVEAIKNASEQILRNESNKTNESTYSKNAEVIMQKAKTNAPFLNLQSSTTPIATRTTSLGARFTPIKTESKIQPAKEFPLSPAPQEVVVKNQNSGTINQNVSNRLLAHAITGGLGLGDSWNG